MKNLFIKNLLYCFCLIIPCLITTVKAQPNVIYILADDLGYGDVNFGIESLDRFKNPHIKTPNLAKLAAESLVFTHQYSSSPICSPARAGLLTGRVPNRANIDLFIEDKKEDDKVFLSGKEITIAELLKEAGYSTAIFGKWHLNGANWEDKKAWTGWTGSFPNQQGFDYGLVSKENPHLTRALEKNAQKDPGDFFNLKGEPAGVIEGFSSQIITDHAIDWIAQQRNETQPFFLYLPYDAVHEFIQNPDEYNNMYKTGDYDKDQYYANVTYLDFNIGRLLDALDSLNLREETIVFFSSDNGPAPWRTNPAAGRSFGTSYPLHGQKKQLLEGGIRVPGLVSWPGTIEPGVSDAPNFNCDVLPTVCDFAKVEVPESLKLDGVSLYDHIMEGKAVERSQPMYWQFEKRRSNWVTIGEEYNRRYVGNKSIEAPTPQVVIRQGDYVLHGFHNLALYSKPEYYKLYNVKRDQMLEHDISKEEPKLFEQMKKQLEALHTDVNKDRAMRQEEITKRINQNL